MNVRDDFDGLVDVIEDDYGLSEHEKGFGQAWEWIGEGFSGFGDGFKVGD